MISGKSVSRNLLRRVAFAALGVFGSVGAAQAADTDWMIGTWTGTGSQAGTQSQWSIQLTVQRQTGGNAYKIDYPSLDCGGYWTLNDTGAANVSFTEHITYGRNKCVDLGTISVATSGAGQMTFHWTGTQPNGSIDTADALLTRKPS